MVAGEVSAQKIYNVITKIKKNMIHGRNMVEEVLCLSVERGYTVFYRNCDDNNVLIDIAMIRTWLYVLIMYTTYRTNKYNMPLLEAVGMTPTDTSIITVVIIIIIIVITTPPIVLSANVEGSNHGRLRIYTPDTLDPNIPIISPYKKFRRGNAIIGGCVIMYTVR
ncbi:hypothetical protein M9H77_29731 [Catharanthus roseus]|uniref:Uncharacterized protein n=1 Tax=Catharanthus roseus TaxID=4058 RepID=A0ACB9ZX74_CATRO|nr:hypothetical protein M9H77_29731 [Catharanthus roseus]